MATKRLTMQKLREILRHKLQLKRSHREAAKALGVSSAKVAGAASRAKHCQLDWAAVCGLDDVELETRMYGPRGGRRDGRPLPDPVHIHTELHRPGVTLQLLHLEYLESSPDGYRYTKYCELYRDWCKRRAATMRQTHVAGDKMFVDYSGKKPHIVDPATGEQIEVELFVAVLGASNYTYAEATLTQQLADWIGSNTRALSFFWGVPKAIVPDQLKSAVTKACRYDPAIQKTFDEFAEHYGTTILPARPYKPRDKAKVEVAVQVAQRWILARLRNADVLLTRRAERAYSRTARRAERSHHACVRGQSPRAVRAIGTSRPRATAHRCLRVRGLEESRPQCRLPRRL